MPEQRCLGWTDGDYSASLDGRTLAGDRLLEIKCPFKGRESTLWRSVEEGRLPEHYQWQVQHQLMVTKAEAADLFVFDGTEGIQLEVAPDPNTWPQIYGPGTSSCGASRSRRHRR
jgi:hypothetical protein